MHHYQVKYRLWNQSAYRLALTSFQIATHAICLVRHASLVRKASTWKSQMDYATIATRLSMAADHVITHRRATAVGCEAGPQTRKDQDANVIRLTI